jgi:hypothetical protein
MDTKKSAGEPSSPVACSALLIAFVQGAAWWEYHQTKATMWQSDRRLAEEEATRREENGTLGVLPNSPLCVTAHSNTREAARHVPCEVVDARSHFPSGSEVK